MSFIKHHENYTNKTSILFRAFLLTQLFAQSVFSYGLADTEFVIREQYRPSTYSSKQAVRQKTPTCFDFLDQIPKIETPSGVKKVLDFTQPFAPGFVECKARQIINKIAIAPLSKSLLSMANKIVPIYEDEDEKKLISSTFLEPILGWVSKLSLDVMLSNLAGQSENLTPQDRLNGVNFTHPLEALAANPLDHGNAILRLLATKQINEFAKDLIGEGPIKLIMKSMTVANHGHTFLSMADRLKNIFSNSGDVIEAGKQGALNPSLEALTAAGHVASSANKILGKHSPLALKNAAEMHKTAQEFEKKYGGLSSVGLLVQLLSSIGSGRMSEVAMNNRLNAGKIIFNNLKNSTDLGQHLEHTISKYGYGFMGGLVALFAAASVYDHFVPEADSA
jgi:hypothetical protein